MDAIVVLGHRPPRTRAGIDYETRMRVERGVALFRAGAAPRLLFSGGRSTPEWVEAEVMSEHAVRLGTPSQAILHESQSRNTIENARLSVAILRSLIDHAPSIVLVTSDYHIERAAALFRCAGAEVTTSAAKLQLTFGARLSRRVREALVRVSYWFIDECELATYAATKSPRPSPAQATD